jgi:hypothetical protein
MFSTSYVPEGYTTEDPQQVRYILYCTKGATVEGYYSNGGGVGLKQWVKIEILDRQTGETIGSEQFFGGPPPSSISSNSNTKRHYGSSPSQEKIEEWILSVVH